MSTRTQARLSMSARTQAQLSMSTRTQARLSMSNGHKLIIDQSQTNRHDLVSNQYQSEARNYQCQINIGTISARMFQQGPAINVNRDKILCSILYISATHFRRP